MKVDDSGLLHYSEGYDPAKAREYYLRTRKLKGRKKGRAEPPKTTYRPKGSPPPKAATQPKGDQHQKARARRKALLAEKERLERRLDRLEEVLREAVEAAKKRSGVETKEEKKADKKETKEKPLTKAEKREKAKEERERREKEEPKTTLSQDIETLRGQIADIRDKIQDALEDARRKTRSKPKPKRESNHPDGRESRYSKQEGERQNGRRDR
jgi:hypothetical protein